MKYLFVLFLVSACNPFAKKEVVAPQPQEQNVILSKHPLDWDKVKEVKDLNLILRHLYPDAEIVIRKNSESEDLKTLKEFQHLVKQ